MNVYSYEVTDTQMDVQRGLFIWYHTKIPLVKVHVETLTGLIFENLNLASVKNNITAVEALKFPHSYKEMLKHCGSILLD